jgi:peptidoglycan-associated lipoprotein
MKIAKLTLPLTLLIVSLALLGCPKKPPKAAPDAAPLAPAPQAPTTDVAADARPDTGADQVQVDPLSDPDIANLNSHVRDRGLLGDVYFDFDRAELKSESRDRLSRNADFLKSRPEFLVTIEGHCDERGTNEYNLALGDRRATVTRDYLVSLGVAASRIRIISYGEERPVCREGNEGCWWQNRRSHFLVTGRTGG